MGSNATGPGRKPGRPSKQSGSNDSGVTDPATGTEATATTEGTPGADNGTGSADATARTDNGTGAGVPQSAPLVNEDEPKQAALTFAVTPPTAPKTHKGRRTEEQIARDWIAAHPTTPVKAAAKAATGAEAAKGLVAVLDTLAVALVGPDGAISDQEHLLIDESLPEVLNRMTPAVVAQVETVLYPGMLAVGLGIWGLRVAGLAAAKQRQANAKPKAAPVIQSANGTGAAGAAMTDQAATPAGPTDKLADHDSRDNLAPRGL